MKKTSNKWKTDNCGRCGKTHQNYTGKLDSKGIEYVVCENTNKRMNISGKGQEGNTFIFSTIWNKTLNV
jgi:intracellular sulfur oxidation DsrE/DsrF family protein